MYNQHEMICKEGFAVKIFSAKKVIIISALSALLLCACSEDELAESNPVVQASEYVSDNAQILEGIGDNKETQLSGAEEILAELE